MSSSASSSSPSSSVATSFYLLCRGVVGGVEDGEGDFVFSGSEFCVCADVFSGFNNISLLV